MAERFSYYGMRALFVLYLVAVFYNSSDASQVFGSYAGLVYLTPLLGGWLASRYWGTRRSVIVGAAVMSVGHLLLFASACFAKQSIFADPAAGGIIDPSVDNTLAIVLMFAGLAVLIFGNGFFKPNLAAMVGDLYPADEITNDSRRDAAYTIYYMGVNVGAFLAPLVCGYVAYNGRWDDPGAFKWAFLCASIAMMIGMIVFIALKNKMLVSPDGRQIGLAPEKAPEQAVAKQDKIVKNSFWSMIVCLALGVGLFVAFSVGAANFNDYITAAVYAVSIALPCYIISDKSLTRKEKMGVGVIFIVAAFTVFFWAAYEQASSSLTIFADRQCNRMLGSWEMPTAWFQTINPIAIIIFAPVMAILWEKLAMKKIEPSSPAKQAMGLMMLAVGYGVIAFGTYGITGSAKASMWWLVILYLIHTVAELCLSPIGQSLVYKLSPARMVSLLMGVWFMSSAASNVLAGSFATLLPQAGEAPKYFLGLEVATLSDFFLIFAVMGGVASVVLFTLCPLLNKMMNTEPSEVKKYIQENEEIQSEVALA
ncbi:MAG: peptide MFS transporter [Muribaculaceae bacterium]|nr:peptide MFS transporter [Muribaculaceae bacterium]